MDEAIEADMKRRYTTWRYNLHKKFLQYESVEKALENRLENVGEDDWNYLINWWQDDEWLVSKFSYSKIVHTFSSC